MGMSKKDYQAIAGAFYATRVFEDASRKHADAMKAQWRASVEFVAEALAADNPRFDRARFLEACETGACQGMRREGA